MVTDASSQIYDAELKDPLFIESLALLLCCGMHLDKGRSYLYLREHSIEQNFATSFCCGAFPSVDSVTVHYFDKGPYAPSTCFQFKAPFCPSCCIPVYGPATPKFDVFEYGCMCCFNKVGCGKKLVLMPFDQYCFCCSNRVTCFHNNCGCCGPVTGNPVLYSEFLIQPTDPAGFAAAVNLVMRR